MMDRRWRVGGLLCLVAVAAACSPDTACVRGESRSCACATGATGAQLCSRDRGGWARCSCAAAPMADGGPVTGCGDGVCSAGENTRSCETDCPPRCGDGLCTDGEDPASCASDCPGFCGDMICLGGEMPTTCPSDCPAACGDGACTHDETANCEADCRARCGDGLCTHSETESSCGADCDPVCGDSVCSAAGESCASCAPDCGACLPPSLTFFVIGALVRPWDNGNVAWDGSSVVNAVLRDDVIRLLAGTSAPNAIVTAIAARVATAGFSLTVAPDIYGVARIRVDGVPYPDLDVALTATEEDAYQVEFSAGGWIAPGEATIRITVTLADRDVVFDDPIGTVDLDEEDLRQAWNEHPDASHWIQVSDQMTPILFLRVLVRATP